MEKILIANRGEIALRIIKTAKKMGIKTLAVFSKVDRGAPHVRAADQAVCIGEGPSGQSYLQGERIIETALEFGADAIHPGYGFLSENANFAETVENKGIRFIGPGAAAIRLMGNKLAAKNALLSHDIPMVPGGEGAITDLDQAKKLAGEIGYPVLIKAAAGGGGKGMRVVKGEGNLESDMKRAISEADSSFGDGSIFIEKYIRSPRHIEVQIMADSQGNCIHLFERECSIQRRHQKVVEEAPSSLLDPGLRDAMGQAAIRVAKACGYVGAGTVEFLVDADKGFHFLEMNTRLQVEHPVTEMITGLDLVELQIRVARGERLPIAQEDVKIHGHAVELRVYAEDPLDNFLPSVGRLETYLPPKGAGIRVDDGYRQGMEVPLYYDPMLAKLIVHGRTREEAMGLMLGAIADFRVEGVQTTLPFGRFVFSHGAFRSGNFDTHFVGKHYDAKTIRENDAQQAELAALLTLHRYLEDKKILRLPKH